MTFVMPVRIQSISSSDRDTGGINTNEPASTSHKNGHASNAGGFSARNLYPALGPTKRNSQEVSR